MKTKTPLRRRRKGELSKLTEDLDKLFAEVIKTRDQHTCQKCGKVVTGSNSHCAHVLPKGEWSFLRYHLLNALCLCYHCHINWAHKNPLAFTLWFQKKFAARFDFLVAMQEKSNTDEFKQEQRAKKSVAKIEERRALMAELKEKLEVLRRGGL